MSLLRLILFFRVFFNAFFTYTHRLGTEVCKVFPDLLLATMDILYSQYKMIKTKGGGGGGSFGDAGNERDLSTLRDRAKALTSMAATIPYRMPGDTNSRLVQTEILMH